MAKKRVKRSKKSKTPIMDWVKKNKIESEKLSKYDRNLKKLESDMIKMKKYEALYFKYHSMVESEILAIRAGFDSQKQYFSYIADLNKKIDEVRQKKSKTDTWLKSRIPLPDPKTVADALLQEGFVDQVDADFLKKKTLDVLDRQKELANHPLLKPKQIVK